jgi:hypothetical protein
LFGGKKKKREEERKRERMKIRIGEDNKGK